MTLQGHLVADGERHDFAGRLVWQASEPPAFVHEPARQALCADWEGDDVGHVRKMR